MKKLFMMAALTLTTSVCAGSCNELENKDVSLKSGSISILSPGLADKRFILGFTTYRETGDIYWSSLKCVKSHEVPLKRSGQFTLPKLYKSKPSAKYPLRMMSLNFHRNDGYIIHESGFYLNPGRQIDNLKFMESLVNPANRFTLVEIDLSTAMAEHGTDFTYAFRNALVGATGVKTVTTIFFEREVKEGDKVTVPVFQSCMKDQMPQTELNECQYVVRNGVLVNE